MVMDLNRRLFLATSAAASGAALTGCGSTQPLIPRYTANEESLDTHQTPEWFKDAKYGIFIHWGPASIPAFAPTEITVEEMFGGVPDALKLNPYSLWYQNTMRFEDGPTAQFHKDTYGSDFSYDEFGGMFNESLDNWDPDEWARVFKRSGARYVVLVTKHHDGFLLWPSDIPNPHKQNWQTERDVVGELAEACRGQGLRFGLYYSGGIDWTFNDLLIEGWQSLAQAIPGDKENYTKYANAHYFELTKRYQPDYLWNDIAYPTDQATFDVLADYYNTVPDGLTNDRWRSRADLIRRLAGESLGENIGHLPPHPKVWDVRTPEYAVFDHVLPFYWETTRGMGTSFCYNRNESPDNFLTSEEITRMLVQCAAFNGNVLLNVGPRGDAQLDPPQIERLDAVGDWLSKNGEYIQDTRAVGLPADQSVATSVGAMENDSHLYIHLFETPGTSSVEIALPEGFSGSAPKLINGDEDAAVISGQTLTVTASEWPDSITQIIEIQKG